VKLRGAAQLGKRRGDLIRIVARDIGVLQMLLGGALLVPLLVALAWGELYSALAFFVAGLITVACGTAAWRLFRHAGEPERHHAMIIASAGWMVSAGFGSLPFLLAAWWTPEAVAQAFVPAGETYLSSLFHFRNPLHAFFEAMSGYTTTGMSMAVHPPSIGHGLLFYRSQMQWIGGVGVIVLALAIIPRSRAVGGLDLFQSELGGMKLRPNIVGTARAIWKIYAALTAIIIIYLFCATIIAMPDYPLLHALFLAVNHAMSGVSTGGFSPLDGSVGGFGSAVMEMIHLLPMIVGAIAFPLYYEFLKRREFSVFRRDPQVRLMMAIFAIVIPLLMLSLYWSARVANPLTEAIFQVVSAVSGTGWQTAAIGEWSAASIFLLAFGTMLIGGAAGSTSGGFKLIRAYVLLRAIQWRLKKIFLPAEAILPFRVGTRNLPASGMQREVADAAVLTFLYMVLLLVALAIVTHVAPPDVPLANVIFDTISAQGAMGLSSGFAHPEMPVVAEVLFIIQMWVGRLEIFPALVLVRAMIAWLTGR
jgi:trk system potassium uptake protein